MPAQPEALRLGSYEILRRLARGGMAELFLARTVGPEGFEKLVVLKKILPRLGGNPKFVRLFLDEARLAASLDHPNVAHVYDLGRLESSYFFAMEYVHGQDLHATVKRTALLGRRVPIDHAVQLAHAVASALHYAHERRGNDGTLLGIVHRDVSPSNVLVSYDGAIKLVDFGVAKAATSTQKTRTGTLKGKISYMSPEQASGAPIDRRSDVFALGIMLWELVTSQRLFKSDNDLATIQRIIHTKAEPPRALRPECPGALETIVLKALAIDPAERYQTAEELQLDLEELAREHKLVQSTVALRAFMHELFAAEITAWQSAQASGVTLTAHLAASEPTTQDSDGEASLADDDEPDLDDDPDDAATQAPADELAELGETRRMPSFRDLEPMRPSPVPPPQLAPVFAPPAPAFPIAPREWRAPGPGANGELRIKRAILGVLALFALLALLALALGGREPAPIPPAEASPVIEMTPQPAAHR